MGVSDHSWPWAATVLYVKLPEVRDYCVLIPIFITTRNKVIGLAWGTGRKDGWTIFMLTAAGELVHGLVNGT